ncbi:hypothetical protein [Winogradskyella helgolandensis]|uniref:hypothetical protein n=1 Tax=Winogradskyella helgolandensis TaxID=2697010 RepID=UPI0015BD9A10|nr:hypothetical protein [Winogradskyella helgolandensis]
MRKTHSKLIKKILIGLLIIGFFIFMTNFDVFGEPTGTVLKVECDYKGLRKIKLTEISGNATTNRSLHIYATYCNNNNAIPEPIFVVDVPFVNRNDVSFKWKNFDTLTIKYDKRLKIIKQKTVSESINPKIIFEYITK